MAPDRLTGSGWLHERPTLDVVVLVLTIVVALAIIGGVVVVGWLNIAAPGAAETREIITVLDGQIGTILGALLGLIAGQAAGRKDTTDRIGVIK